MRYESRTETPLKFHYFFRFFILPLHFLSVFAGIAQLSSNPIYYTWFGAIYMAYYIADIALTILCFAGFFRWKPYAWYCTMAFLVLSPVFYLFVLLVYAAYLPSDLITAAGQVIGSLIFSIPVGIYYIKRKLLFSVGPRPGEQGASAADGQSSYCRKCGQPLPAADSRYCRICGTSAEADNSYDMDGR